MPEISLRQLLIGALVLALATVLGLAALSGSIPSGLAGWAVGAQPNKKRSPLIRKSRPIRCFRWRWACRRRWVLRSTQNG